MKTQARILKLWLAMVGLLAWVSTSHAQELDLGTAPLFLGSNVDGNVFFELDDSGSMQWEIMTNTHHVYKAYWASGSDSTTSNGLWSSWTGGSSSTPKTQGYAYIFDENDNMNVYGSWLETTNKSIEIDWRIRSSDFNLIYYDPDTFYSPWEGLPDASFSAARSDPYTGTNGYTMTRNLSGFVFEVWEDDHGFQGSSVGGPDDATDGANGVVDLWDSRVRYTINSTDYEKDSMDIPSAAAISALNTNCNYWDADDWHPYDDCFGTVRTNTTHTSTETNPWGRNLAEEQQNIANWYQYYRRRALVAKASISAVINNSPDFRYGLTLINDFNDLFVEVPGSGVSDYTTHNSTLLASLFGHQWGFSGTPLRKGLQYAGKYFDGVLSGKTDPIISECQQNFSVLLTDGFWNGSQPSSIGDTDGDSRTATVADVAKYYYDLDLSVLPDNVPASIIDPNNQQHMVTFAVAFGVEGDLVDTNNNGLPNPELTESSNWGNPFSSTRAKIDDLWHAAYNSKGGFISAKTPAELIASLDATISEIADRVGASSSVATNSGTLQAGSHLFQARFRSGEWSGQLFAFALNADGSINSVPNWEASDILDAKDPDNRAILTFKPGSGGIPFRFPSNYNTLSTNDLDADQIDLLLSDAPYPTPSGTIEIAENQSFGEDLLNYLRGGRDNENGTRSFRVRRGGVLGDIVDSNPRYVGVPRAHYPDDLESVSYDAFRTTYASRDKMVYVGANDGMLHGFRESDGNELLAFIPNKVFSKLASLAYSTGGGFQHQYFVNGSPSVVDAYLDGSYNAWRSVLVSGLGGGAQSVFALDVTNPAAFSEANAASIALWEFDDSDDADMGYSYSIPVIGKMQNGQWVAIFGNGYNNSEADGIPGSGTAVLYIVDLDTGALISKIDTESGASGTPNGLSSPALVDVDGDYVMDIIYAGDIEGNMWKFDISSGNPADWDIAFHDGTTPKPLFTLGTSKPITTRPQVTNHPNNLGGYMVYFGTGKYLENGDDNPTGASTQSFYGIWDKDDGVTPNILHADLLQQFITNQYTEGFDTTNNGSDDTYYKLRDVSEEDIDFDSHLGWYINLKPQQVEGVNNIDNFGERSVSNPIVRDGKVIFSTLSPSQGLCDFGGSSFIMVLDYRDGGALGYPAFDTSGDGVFDDTDTLASGIVLTDGITNSPSIIVNEDSEILYVNDGSDVPNISFNAGRRSLGRQSWRQLFR